MDKRKLKLRDKVNAGTPEGESELLDIIRCGLADVMIDARIAIHAYVEKVKREAREGKCCERDYDGDGNCDIHSAPGKLRNAALSVPASGDASGETRLGDLLDHMLAEHGAVISPTEMSRDERCAHVVLRDSYKADILRLYRATTGEVVGTGEIVSGVFQTPTDGPSSVTVYLDQPIRVIGPETRVSLVLRRGKEER